MNFECEPLGRFGAALLAVLLVSVVILIGLFPPGEWVPVQRWGQWLESSGLPGALIFLLLSTLATSVGLPRQLVALIAGLAYGVLLGLMIALVAALSGCSLTVYCSRRFLSRWVSTRYPAFIDRLNALLSEDTFAKVIVLRLQPLGTNLLTNLCVGCTSVSRLQFLLASGIGYVPQMLVFVLLGAGLRVESNAQFLLSAVLLIISILLGFVLLRRHRRRSIHP